MKTSPFAQSIGRNTSLIPTLLIGISVVIHACLIRSPGCEEGPQNDTATPFDPSDLIAELRKSYETASETFGQGHVAESPAAFADKFFVIPEGDQQFRPPDRFTDERWKSYLFAHYYQIYTTNKPIDGRIKFVDQNGRGVSDAKVVLSLSLYHPSLRKQLETEGPLNTAVRVFATTDEHGIVEFEGWHLRGISIVDVRADGIHAEYSAVSASSIDGRNPDVATPMDKTIKVWRVLPPDGEVVEHSFRGYLLPREEPHYLNLRSGELVDDPQDADIAIVYGIDMDAPGPVQRRPWTMDIHVPGGGIQAADMPYLFEAPEDGYQPSFTRSHEDPTELVIAPHFRLYVRHRDGGMHSAIEGRAGAWRDGRLQLNLNWRTNLEGGRLLQPPDATDPPE